MNTATITSIHPFQNSGLGQAPFRYIGFNVKEGPISWEQDGVTFSSGSPGQPMGTCDHCGTPIKDCFEVQSADGKRSIVGSSCISKLHRADNINGQDRADVVLMHSVKQAANKIKRERKLVKDTARIEAAKDLFNANRAIFEAIDASNNGHQQTKAGQIDWYFENAGITGQVQMSRYIERLIELTA